MKAAPKQVVNWVVRAWNYLKEQQDIIRSFFPVTGISNAINGIQDHLCHPDSALTFAHSDMEGYTCLAKEVDEIQLDFFQMMMRINAHACITLHNVVLSMV